METTIPSKAQITELTTLEEHNASDRGLNRKQSLVLKPEPHLRVPAELTAWNLTQTEL